MAVGLITNEVFISNPTRPKLNFRILKICIIIAIGLGLSIGLFAGGLVQLLFSPSLNIPNSIIRIFGWFVIGIAVGFSEALTWRWRSIEAGNKSRFKKRLITSVVGASASSVIAALLFEILRSQVGEVTDTLRNLEDPVGFSILGLLLGLTFSYTSSPSYMAALRAGAGFEYRQINDDVVDTVGLDPSAIAYPYISSSSELKFVSQVADKDRIEEGLSIQLPDSGTIRIGSATKKRTRHLFARHPIAYS
ncbi:hypothetical protein [Acaryochloris sp. 'Moss Beach']|uniref:hypothetical protein n=1 Tax=Acaryochloris sp. 'Moss Beach' TaxID=2740837 RepID=UPI001F426A90|nr:hypothetical protein [Acaryochloris sp. 'Moss Beach']